MNTKETFKVAVLLTGQLRTWEVAKSGIKAYFDNGVKMEYNNQNRNFEVDYFLHTWDINSWRNPSIHHGRHGSFDILKIPKDSKQKLIDFFNPKFIEIEKFEDFKHPWLPMFYSFMKANQFKRNYEIKNNFVYDLVIRARFDTLYVGKNNISNRTSMVIVKPDADWGNRVVWSTSPEFTKRYYEFNYFNFDDLMWYCDSPTMDVISNIYFHVKNDSVWKNVYGPGTLLYDFFVNYSIHPRKVWDHPWMVVRKKSMKRGLSWPKDVTEIWKDAKNFYEITI
jgi:hypothetical protein